MPVKKKIESCDCNCYKRQTTNSGGGAVYGIGIIGAAFYFFPQVSGFTDFLLAIGKSLIWPAMLVYQAFNLLKF